MRVVRALMMAAQAGMKPDAYIAQVQKDFMRKAENWNRERVLEIKRVRNRNILTGLTLVGTVAAIYSYSIFAIRQETFLDDLNEPETEES